MLVLRITGLVVYVKIVASTFSESCLNFTPHSKTCNTEHDSLQQFACSEILKCNNNGITTLYIEYVGDKCLQNLRTNSEIQEESIELHLCAFTNFTHTIDDILDQIRVLPSKIKLKELYIFGSERCKNTVLTNYSLSTFKYLTTLHVIDSKLTQVEEKAFFGLYGLKNLSLNKNMLTKFKEGVFEDLENLEMLDISENYIIDLPDTIFLNTLELRSISLQENQLKEIRNGLFENLWNLEYLNLAFNSIETIGKDAFKDLSGLKFLNISHNQLFTLSQLFSLIPEEMDQVAREAYSRLNESRSAKMSEIHGIDLSYNSFTTLEVKQLNSFRPIFTEQTLSINLANNKIQDFSFWLDPVEFDPNVIDIIPQRSQYLNLNLENNNFQCSCSLIPFIPSKLKYGVAIDFTTLISVEAIKAYNIRRCYGFKGSIPTDSLNKELLNCTTKSSYLTYVCPDECSCTFVEKERTNYINCEDVRLLQPPSLMFPFPYASHTEINLEGNQIQNFNITGQKVYRDVTHLYLSNNSIRTLDLTGLSNQIKVLDLSNNNLTYLNKQTLDFMMQRATKLMNLSLDSNPWHCDCSAKDFIIAIQQLKFKIPRWHKVTCLNGTLIKLINASDLCATPTSLASHLIITTALVTCFIVTWTIGLCYWYRREIFICLFSSRYSLLRWLVSRTETDENKIYDAFISYAHQDESFVLEHLVPYLERKQFKLCLHFRDWLGGLEISYQILQSIQNSRRVIVVMSPYYLDSVWGKFELKTSFEESLNDCIPKVIVIMVKDVGPICNLDKDLQKYLQMTTYLKWGSPWFWEQLVYSLPHKNTTEAAHVSVREKSLHCLTNMCFVKSTYYVNSNTEINVQEAEHCTQC